MSSIIVGKFKVDVWKEGYPVGIEIYVNGEIKVKITHRDLDDLEFAIKKAKQAARPVLLERYRVNV